MKLEFAQTLTMVKSTRQVISATGTFISHSHAETLTLNFFKPEKCVVDVEVVALTNQMEPPIALVIVVNGTKIVKDLVVATTLNHLKPMRCAVNARVACKP